MSELNVKLTSETGRADKIQFENTKLMEKLEAISLERERILVERDQLKETLEDVRMQQAPGPTSPEFGGMTEGEPDSGMLENIPPSIKARLLRLEKENKQLRRRGQEGAGGQDASVLQTMVEDMREREEELSNRSREANKRVMELEARLEDAAASATLHVPRSHTLSFCLQFLAKDLVP